MPSNARLLSSYPATGVSQSEFDLLDDFTNTIHSSLPVATSSALGAIKVGSNLSVNSGTGVMSATDTTYNNATTSASGLMSNSDKSRIDGMADNANNYSLPVATSSALGGFKVGSGLGINNNDELEVTGVGGGNAFLRDVYTESITVVSGMGIQSNLNTPNNQGETIPDVSGTRKSPEITIPYNSSITKLVIFFTTGTHSHTYGTGSSWLTLSFRYTTPSGTAWSDSNASDLTGNLVAETTDRFSHHWSGSMPSAWVNNGIKIRPWFIGGMNTNALRSFVADGALTMTVFVY